MLELGEPLHQGLCLEGPIDAFLGFAGCGYTLVCEAKAPASVISLGPGFFNTARLC